MLANRAPPKGSKVLRLKYLRYATHWQCFGIVDEAFGRGSWQKAIWRFKKIKKRAAIVFIVTTPLKSEATLNPKWLALPLTSIRHCRTRREKKNSLAAIHSVVDINQRTKCGWDLLFLFVFRCPIYIDVNLWCQRGRSKHHSHYVPAKKVYNCEIGSPLWTHKSHTLCLVSILIRLTCRDTISTYALLAWCPCAPISHTPSICYANERSGLDVFHWKRHVARTHIAKIHMNVIWLETITSCESCRWLYRLSARAALTIIIAQTLFSISVWHLCVLNEL